MQSNLLSLSKVFAERLFRIPDYQRGYAWEADQLIDFWSDLANIKKDRHYTGVVTLETVPESAYQKWEDDLWIIDSKGFTPLYVVDGQQRLTTALIVLQSLLEVCEDRGVTEINYQSLELIRKQYIYDNKPGSLSGSYVFGYEKDNPSYEYLKTAIFKQHSSTNQTFQETVYTANLGYAKAFIKSRIEELNDEQREEVYKRVTQSLTFNIFSISDEVDVFVAFETMNNRGKRLSTLELLKNRLIYLTTRMKLAQRDRAALRKNVNEAWKAIYHFLGKSKQHPLADDQFLDAHFSLHFGSASVPDAVDADGDGSSNISRMLAQSDEKDIWLSCISLDESRFLLSEQFTADNLSPEVSEPPDGLELPSDLVTRTSLDLSGVSKTYRRYFIERAKTIDMMRHPVSMTYLNEYVTSLQVSVKRWHEILVQSRTEDHEGNESARWWWRLARLHDLRRRHSGATDVQVLMLSLGLSDGPGINDALRELERHMFLSSVVRVSYRDAHHILALLAARVHAGQISGETVAETLSQLWRSRLGRSKGVHAFKEAFRGKRGSFYKWSLIRYFLFEYDWHLRSRSASLHASLSWDLLLSTMTEPDYVTVEHIYPQSARAKYWTRRFNIDGLSGAARRALRHSLGNLLPLSKKKNIKLSNKPFPEKVKSIDGEPMGYLFGSYAEADVAGHEEWTPKQIRDRGVKMLQFLEDRWRLNLGTEQDKVEILGLNRLKLS